MTATVAEMLDRLASARDRTMLAHMCRGYEMTYKRYDPDTAQALENIKRITNIWANGRKVKRWR